MALRKAAARESTEASFCPQISMKDCSVSIVGLRDSVWVKDGVRRCVNPYIRRIRCLWRAGRNLA